MGFEVDGKTRHRIGNYAVQESKRRKGVVDVCSQVSKYGRNEL